MNNKFVLGVGPAEKLQTACRRNDCGIELIEWLSAGENLARVKNVQLGHSEIKQISHVIDGDADPFVPGGWKVEEHKKFGQFVWDPDKVELYLSKNQKDGKVIGGNKLRKELADCSTFNANLLDYLLKKKNQHLIPEEWKDKRVFFWGTIYRRAAGGLRVRCLYWGGRWYWSSFWLDVGWVDSPAVSLASQN